MAAQINTYSSLWLLILDSTWKKYKSSAFFDVARVALYESQFKLSLFIIYSALVQAQHCLWQNVNAE